MSIGGLTRAGRRCYVAAAESRVSEEHRRALMVAVILLLIAAGTATYIYLGAALSARGT